MTRRAFSLIEAALVMGVVGLVVGGVWMGVAATQRAAMDQVFYQQTVTLAQNVRTYFSTRPLPSTAADVSTNYTDAVLRAAKVYPEDMCSGTCITDGTVLAKNVFGTGTTILLTQSGATPIANQFIIKHWTPISKRSCVSLLTSLSSLANAIGLAKVRAGTVTTTFPQNIQTMTTPNACAATGVEFYSFFKIRM